MSTEPRKRRYPDHPTATPREPTMADAIAFFESALAMSEATAARYARLFDATHSGAMRDVAMYSHALAAMRAVEAMRELLSEAAARCSEIEEMTRTSNPLASEYAHHTAIRLRKEAAAFPTPTESTDAK